MNKDICVRRGEGVVNIRAGAIIIKDNKFLDKPRIYMVFCHRI